LALLFLRNHSPSLLLAIVGIAIVADTAAYFTGRAFGKHKLAPSISPGKTWEGAVGGAVAVAVYALLLPAPEGIGKLQLIVAALALSVLSVLGDLFESWIKRRAGVKDSSQLLPGHGGILDRIDSQLAVLPVAAFIWIWLT
jgi:phosphatidate cytidylyltransferase